MFNRFGGLLLILFSSCQESQFSLLLLPVLSSLNSCVVFPICYVRPLHLLVCISPCLQFYLQYLVYLVEVTDLAIGVYLISLP